MLTLSLYKPFQKIRQNSNLDTRTEPNLHTGTKCVDPNTGLIYFKYDFGYEFGILFPGEGHKFVSSQWNSKDAVGPNAGTASSAIRNGGRHSPYPLKLAAGSELVIPVQHERTGTAPGYSSDSEAQRRSFVRARATPSPRYTNAHKRYSLPSAHSLDIHLDRLHAQAPRLPPEQMVRTGIEYDPRLSSIRDLLWMLSTSLGHVVVVVIAITHTHTCHAIVLIPRESCRVAAYTQYSL